MLPLTQTQEWQALMAHRNELAPRHLNELFAADPQRFTRLTLTAADLLFDFSKQRLLPETLSLLVRLAEARNLAGFLRRMAAGEPINFTENRAALHIALRAESSYQEVSGENVLPQVRTTQARLRELAEDIRSGRRHGATGQPIRAVVNVGIGGADLGPRMAAQALEAYSEPRLTVRFVANIDPAEFAGAVRDLDPATTLFVISSKTFATQETLANARVAKIWLAAALGSEQVAGTHFLAVTNNLAAATAFGIAPENCLAMPEWVGGRFSLWSAIGLPLACAIGWEHFEELLVGAREMDKHCLNAPFAANMPVLMALISLWNINFLGAESFAVLPYVHRLGLLPAYLQQLEMESSGKRITREGVPVDYATGAILWGMAGTLGQHAFHQLFYQGTRLTPIDFVVSVGEAGPEQDALVASALAQSAALMRGKSKEEARAQLAASHASEEAERLAPHLACPGNQPSSTLLMRTLTPRTLGSLLALYEHKVAVLGCLWGINSFDQWGVEHGKQMAREILPRMLAGESDFDSSTRGLLIAMRQWRQGEPS